MGFLLSCFRRHAVRRVSACGMGWFGWWFSGVVVLDDSRCSLLFLFVHECYSVGVISLLELVVGSPGRAVGF